MSNLNVRCTPDEYQQITEKAKEYGLSISDYSRLVLLKAEILVKVEKESQ